MKKLLLTLVALGVAAGVYAGKAGNAGSATNASRNAQFIWVLNADAVDHEVGDVVVWKDGTYDGIEVSTTTTAVNPLVAGVVAQSILPASGWGFIQTSGYHSGITIGVANAAGDCLVTSTTAEAAGVLTIAESTTTVTADLACFAIALEATTSSTTVKGIIKAL